MQLLQPEQAGLSEASKMPPPAEPAVNRKLFSEFLRESRLSLPIASENITLYFLLKDSETFNLRNLI